MKDPLDRMLAFGPDEDGGGGESAEPAEPAAETAEEETYEVGGEKLSKAEVLKRAENHGKLQGEYTRTRQEMAEMRGRLEELSRRQNNPAGGPAPEPEPDFDKRIADLDPYAPTFSKDLAAIQKEQREWFKAEIEKSRQASQVAAQGQLSASERARVIDDGNRDLFEQVLKDSERCPVTLTREERQDLWEDFQSHVGKSYGEYDASAQRFRRNERAVEAALMAVPSVRAKILAHHTAKAREEGLTAASAGQAAGRSGPGSSPRPSGRGVTFERQLEWYVTASETEQAEFRRANPDFRDKFIKYDRQKKLARG